MVLWSIVCAQFFITIEFKWTVQIKAIEIVREGERVQE